MEKSCDMARNNGFDQIVAAGNHENIIYLLKLFLFYFVIPVFQHGASPSHYLKPMQAYC